jgi:Na+-driven multidrug efflux pump
MIPFVNKQYEKGTYLTGYGIGTALSYILLELLGAKIPTRAKYIVWAIGFIILLIGLWMQTKSRKKL